MTIDIMFDDTSVHSVELNERTNERTNERIIDRIDFAWRH